MFSQLTKGIVLVLAIADLTLSFTSDDLRVTLSNGNKLVGKYLQSYSGRPIKAFTSAPYAKPPVGDLRFRAPEPIGKWHGEYEATDEQPMCSQRNPFARSYEDVGTEDCLYLSVYAPYKLDGKRELMPVMVYIHGGGFMCSSGAGYTPERLLDHDVVLVTPNYRLGPLGFLSSEDENCPGNFGLKDQAMALKWINENIRFFDGDPNSVTIFGSSAGGASSTYLMASPLTAGLIHKAIAQSGTNLAPWSQPAHVGVAKRNAAELARKFNCYFPNVWSRTIDCLRKIPALNITAAFYDFFEFDTDPMVAFTPVVEPDLPGEFLTKHPRDSIPEHALKIPFMTGLNFDEGLLKSAAYHGIPEVFDEFANNLDVALPIAFYYNHHYSFIQKWITSRIKQFYFNNQLTRDNIANATTLFGDGWFLTAMDLYLRLRQSYKDAAPSYVYLLTEKASASYSAIFCGDPETYYGVSHSDESIFLFSLRERSFPTTIPLYGEEQVRETMTQLWTDFARTGNPTPETSYLPKWEKVDGFPVHYYRIGNFNFENKPKFGMETGGLFEDRAQFWRTIDAHAAAHYIDDEL